jgi:putative transcriptional regulator
MLRAKRAIETAVETGEARVRLPNVDNAGDVIRELQSTGIRARRLAHAMDVGEMLRRMRAELVLTQEQFALRFGFDLDALQNWEQGRRKPDQGDLGLSEGDRSKSGRRGSRARGRAGLIKDR